MPITKETEVKINLWALIASVATLLITIAGMLWIGVSYINSNTQASTAALNNQVLDLQKTSRDHAEKLGAKADKK